MHRLATVRGVAPWRYASEEDGHSFWVALDVQVTTNDLRLMLCMTIAGDGIACAPEEVLLTFLARYDPQVIDVRNRASGAATLPDQSVLRGVLCRFMG